MSTPPDDGLHALCAVRPVLHRIAHAGDIVSLPGRWLLHAGPPFDTQESLPPGACIGGHGGAIRRLGGDRRRGRAADCGGRRAIVAGAIGRWGHSACCDRLAVDCCCGRRGRKLFRSTGVRALGTTVGADLRFGTRDASVLERLSRRDQVEAAILASALSQPIDLLELMRSALALGDDLHNRTSTATRLFAAELAVRSKSGSGSGTASTFLRALENTPLYFLTIAMAAAKRMLMAAEGGTPESLVTALGGNGHVFGLQLAKRPGHWIVGPSDAPSGPRFPHVAAEVPVLNAIGDSAVIDALGLGGHALAHAPEPRAALAEYLPDDFVDLPSQLMSIAHPFFEGCRLRMGLDARRAVDNDARPIVTLAMIDAKGNCGLLGRGIFRPSLALFRSALQSIGQHV